MTPQPPRVVSTGSSTDPTIAEPIRTPRRGMVRTAGRHFWKMERWKKAILIVALLIGVVGVAGSVVGVARPKPVQAVEARQTIGELNAVGPRSSLTSEQRVQLESAANQLNEFRHWFYDKTAPQLWRIGLGFALAFVLGYMARQFLKTVAMLAALVLIAGGVAVYLGFLDLTKLRTDMTTGTGWVMDQVATVKEQIVAMLSASVSGTIGFVIGFMRGPRS